MVQGIIHVSGICCHTTTIAMGKLLLTSAIALLLLSCGPEAGEDEAVPGEIVYEQLYSRVYRLDRRIDVIKTVPGEDSERLECGVLTDRAHGEIEATLAPLDPSVDYGEHRPGCMTHGALVYVEGFEHSPFDCSYECCHPDLIRAAVVYTMAINNFYGGYPEIDGEPYVAIEPDLPCP